MTRVLEALWVYAEYKIYSSQIILHNSIVPTPRVFLVGPSALRVKKKKISEGRKYGPCDGSSRSHNTLITTPFYIAPPQFVPILIYRLLINQDIKFIKSSESQSTVPRSSSISRTWELVRNEILGPILRSAGSEILRVGISNLCFNKSSR